ncbi:MAG: RNA 2',3'-cyclic phosphodiesterase [Bacteroidales bacterium]|nr:RNA 2',3'-cyclic phosphodiesterase [Bacteroidales bacterium]
MKRLFIAIHVPCNEGITDLLERLRRQLIHERINWSKPENLHLTLKFLGETSDESIPGILKEVSLAVEKVAPFGLVFDRTGIFGSRYDPRIIWVGNHLDAQQPVAALANQVLDACARAGFERDRQNFVPHLTLGRIKNINNKPYFQQVMAALPQKLFQEMMVDKLILFESILRKEGPIYVPLQQIEFKGKMA